MAIPSHLITASPSLEGYALRFRAAAWSSCQYPNTPSPAPAGSEASFDWRAAFDDSEGTMLSRALILYPLP